MSNLTDDDIDGLANRLALLAADNGEAENAGRAVGVLARKLGLTGGQLKAMFLEGARNGGGTAKAATMTARLAALETEAEALRDTLRKQEHAQRALQRDRDALFDEVEALNNALSRRRAARRTRWGAVALAGLVVLSVVWLASVGPRLHLGGERVEMVNGVPVYHVAVVHDRAVALRRQPDPAAEALATVAIGTKLTVHKTLWHGFQQWVEVELNGQTGYVLSADVDLS